MVVFGSWLQSMGVKGPRPSSRRHRGRESTRDRTPTARWMAGVLLAMGGLLAWQQTVAYRADMDHVEHMVRQMARSEQHYILRDLRAFDHLLTEAARALAEPNAAPTAVLAEAHAGLRAVPEALGIVWIDSNGRARATTLTANFPNTGAVDLSDREYFRHYTQAPYPRDLFVGPLVTGKISGRTVFHICRPVVTANGEWRGVVVISVDAVRWNDHFASAAANDHALAGILRADGRFLAGTPAAASLFRDHATNSAIVAANRDGLAHWTDKANQRVTIAYAPIGDYPLVAAAGQSTHAAMAAWGGKLALEFMLLTALAGAAFALARRADREWRRRGASMAVLRANNDGLAETVADRTQELAAANERLELALEASTDGLWEWDEESNQVTLSDRFRDMLGYTGAAEGATLATLAMLAPDDDWHQINAFITGAQAAKFDRLELEQSLRHRDGHAVHVLTRVLLRRSAEGAITRVAGTVTDIARRKAAERQRDEVVTRLTRVNADLQRYAEIAAHHLREPLRLVGSYVGLLHPFLPPHGEAQDYATCIAGACRRMQTLLAALQRYTALDVEPVTTEADCAVCLQEALTELQPTIDGLGALVSAEALPRIRGDARQIRLVLHALVANALQFRHPDRPPVVHLAAVRRQNMWRLSVRDNGIGIEPDYRQRVFRLFERLNNDADTAGTGLGLAMCRKVVERHGGEIWVQAVDTFGADLVFTLPALPADHAEC